MPELPDLQVFSRNLNKTLHGKKVEAVHVPVSRKLNVSGRQLNIALTGQDITEVFREGKELHFKFSKGDVLALHLMLRGKLYTFEDVNEHKYTILELVFTDKTGLALTDFQEQATPTFNPEKKNVPDALSDEADYDFLREKTGKTRANIKNLLMDQHIIRGIGNAYADEILWDARIDPSSLSNKIPEGKIKTLAKSIKKVLKDAEEEILKKHPDIINGEVRDFLRIHNPKRKTSPGGARIQIKKSGRKTYYTNEQELFK